MTAMAFHPHHMVIACASSDGIKPGSNESVGHVNLFEMENYRKSMNTVRQFFLVELFPGSSRADGSAPSMSRSRALSPGTRSCSPHLTVSFFLASSLFLYDTHPFCLAFLCPH